MDNEDVIRDQMEDTRTALTEKLETLEQKVADTVESATTNVAETVEAVKETVQETVSTVKDTVQETIGAVKGSVQDSVEAVKDAFDIKGHVESHPWVMFAGSVAAGFVVGRLFGPSKAEEDEAHEDEYEEPSHAVGTFHNGRHRHEEEPEEAEERPAGGGWLKKLAPEFDKLKGLALGAVLAAVRNTVVNAAPPQIKDSLAEVFDSFGNKLGAFSPSKGQSEDSAQDWSQRRARAM